MIIKSDFKPAWWLTGPNLQTSFASFFRKRKIPEGYWKRLELADGDFIDLYISGKQNDDEKEVKTDTTPLVVLLHGLEGSINSPYSLGVMSQFVKMGWGAIQMHFRGCSGAPNRNARAYHSGETEDFTYVLNWLTERYPSRPVAAVGFSLGGSVLLNYLGKVKSETRLVAGVAVSVPLQLDIASQRINQGFSRAYQKHLLSTLRIKIAEKESLLKQLNLSKEDVMQIADFYEFDDKITAPLHDFKDAEDYYTKSSARQYLKHIARPTLIIHATDDPFMTKAVIPEENELSASVTLELSDYGGHVGFIGGKNPLEPEYYLDKRIPQYLSKYF